MGGVWPSGYMWAMPVLPIGEKHMQVCCAGRGVQAAVYPFRQLHAVGSKKGTWLTPQARVSGSQMPSL